MSMIDIPNELTPSPALASRKTAAGTPSKLSSSSMRALVTSATARDPTATGSGDDATTPVDVDPRVGASVADGRVRYVLQPAVRAEAIDHYANGG
jgi:hypothetical protein